MAMAIPVCLPDSDSLCSKDPIPLSAPYFLRPFISASEGAGSSKESSTATSFHSIADRLSVASMDLGTKKGQPPSANESDTNPATNPCSAYPNGNWSIHTPVVHTEVVEGDRSSLKTLELNKSMESTGTTGISERFEESALPSPYGSQYQVPLSTSHRKDRDALQFRKWIKSFRRKEPKSRTNVYPSIEHGVFLNTGDAVSIIPSSKTGTKTPSSSMRLVTAVKTASHTFASLSVTGGSARRKSSGGTLDDATVMRMQDRRCALEELINTEEYYIHDLKNLKNVGLYLF